MSCTNETTNKCGNQVTFTDDPDEYVPSFYKISQKAEIGCFSEFFDNLSNAENLLDLEHLQMADVINQSNICYWKNRRKSPKFMHEYYLLGDTIGKGSYGKVKDCVDIRTMKRYAMKIVHRMKIKKIPGGMKHVENEINLMKTLFHENVVRLIDDFQEMEPERRCIVMEFCLGSIHDLQTNGILDFSNQFRCLPEWQTRQYFIQIIEGLEYLHDHGLIHKDMKPGNFLLTEHEVVKITDFGVSERLEMFQTNSFISGGQTTPAIQPPELAIGAANICGYKLDIYGTGVSLYFMLCGRVPFNNPNILLIFDEIAVGEYTISEWVSKPASDLIRNMMRKDIKERFDIKSIKNHNWCLNPGKKIGAKVDPKIHLHYAARDHTKENVYRLSTAMSSVADSKESELPAIMPLTVSSRLRTYYNWPMTEDEENAEIDEQLIIGEDFIGMDINHYERQEEPYNGEDKSQLVEGGPLHGIRFFINSEEKNDSHSQAPFVEVDNKCIINPDVEYLEDFPMSTSMPQSAFGQREFNENDNVSHNTIPLASSSSRNNSPATNATQKNSDKKGSSKSKLKLSRKIPRCTQS